MTGTTDPVKLYGFSWAKIDKARSALAKMWRVPTNQVTDAEAVDSIIASELECSIPQRQRTEDQ
jgi:hypothetical protein